MSAPTPLSVNRSRTDIEAELKDLTKQLSSDDPMYIGLRSEMELRKAECELELEVLGDHDNARLGKQLNDALAEQKTLGDSDDHTRNSLDNRIQGARARLEIVDGMDPALRAKLLANAEPDSITHTMLDPNAIRKALGTERRMHEWLDHLRGAQQEAFDILAAIDIDTVAKSDPQRPEFEKRVRDLNGDLERLEPLIEAAREALGFGDSEVA